MHLRLSVHCIYLIGEGAQAAASALWWTFRVALHSGGVVGGWSTRVERWVDGTNPWAPPLGHPLHHKKNFFLFFIHNWLKMMIKGADWVATAQCNCTAQSTHNTQRALISATARPNFVLECVTGRLARSCDRCSAPLGNALIAGVS